jgi:DNA-directed RNA polymerase specialized sigma24 family protein
VTPDSWTTIALMDADGSDAELVAQTLQGVTAAFQQLTLRYYRPVGGFILKRVGRPDLVEDLVQETFLEAFQALRQGREPRHFSSWLFGIAHNRCGKWLRRKRPVLFDPQEPRRAFGSVAPRGSGGAAKTVFAARPAPASLAPGHAALAGIEASRGQDL